MSFIIYTERIGWYLEKNIIEDLKRKLLNYKVVGEFLADLKKEFREEENEMIKVAELKKVK